MRVNPKYNNTCHDRIGMYREEQCIAGSHPCTFLGECDEHYDPETGEWDYPNPLAPRGSEPIVKGQHTEKELTYKERGGLTAIRNSGSKTRNKKFQPILDRDEVIRKAVMENTDKCGGVYTDVLVNATGLDRQCITDYLKQNGFEKPSGKTSRRWVKDWASNPLDYFVTPEDLPADPDEEQERDPPLNGDQE